MTLVELTLSGLTHSGSISILVRTRPLYIQQVTVLKRFKLPTQLEKERKCKDVRPGRSDDLHRILMTRRLKSYVSRVHPPV